MTNETLRRRRSSGEDYRPGDRVVKYGSNSKYGTVIEGPSIQWDDGKISNASGYLWYVRKVVELKYTVGERVYATYTKQYSNGKRVHHGVGKVINANHPWYRIAFDGVRQEYSVHIDYIIGTQERLDMEEKQYLEECMVKANTIDN